MLNGESGNGGMVMPVGPMYGSNGGFGDFGNSGWWIILLFLLLGNNWNNGGSFNGGGIYPWMNQSNQISGGFRDQMLSTQLQGIQNGVIGLGSQAQSNVIADMERSFAAQTASTAAMTGLQSQLATCCCENRLASANLGALVQSENCADREALSNGIRDLITNQNAGIQKILDTMCQDKIDAKNERIAELQNQLTLANLAASQNAQTATIQAGQRALANEVEQYVLPTPRPAYIVQNPNCCQQNYACGCGV